jgi:hypothetical protein
MKTKKYDDNFIFQRNCPTCNTIIKYKSYQGYESGIKKNSKCRKCGCGWSKGLTKETNDSLKKIGELVSAKNKGCTPWNKGLNKNTHPSVQIISEKVKGRTHSIEALEKISKASISHWKNKHYRELVIERVKETYTEERIREWREKMENGGHFTPLEEKDEVEQYRQLVWYYTRKNDLSKLENYKNRGRLDENKNAYHLDHIYSITSGYINKVPPQIIGCIHNLRFIPALDNQIKKTKNDISLKKLKKLYYGISKS